MAKKKQKYYVGDRGYVIMGSGKSKFANWVRITNPITYEDGWINTYNGKKEIVKPLWKYKTMQLDKNGKQMRRTSLTFSEKSIRKTKPKGIKISYK